MLRVHDAKIPATGVRITRSWHLARTSVDGHGLWMGRRKQPAGPGRPPRLVHDVVVRHSTPPS